MNTPNQPAVLKGSAHSSTSPLLELESAAAQSNALNRMLGDLLEYRRKLNGEDAYPADQMDAGVFELIEATCIRLDNAFNAVHEERKNNKEITAN